MGSEGRNSIVLRMSSAGGSPRSGVAMDPVSRAILASAERARRLASTVSLSTEAEPMAAPRRRRGVSAWLGGLGLWTIALFLLSLE